MMGWSRIYMDMKHEEKEKRDRELYIKKQLARANKIIENNKRKNAMRKTKIEEDLL